jgi:hypothetical protein
MPLSAGVHHEVDRRATTQNPTGRDDTFTASELFGLISLVEMSIWACWRKMVEIEDRVLDAFHAAVVWTSFDHENREAGIGLSEATGNYASCRSTYRNSAIGDSGGKEESPPAMMTSTSETSSASFVYEGIGDASAVWLGRQDARFEDCQKGSVDAG